MPLLDALTLGFCGATSAVCHHGVLMEATCDQCFEDVEEMEREGLL